MILTSQHRSAVETLSIDQNLTDISAQTKKPWSKYSHPLKSSDIPTETFNWPIEPIPPQKYSFFKELQYSLNGYMWFFGSSGDSHFLTKFWYFAKFWTMKFFKQPRHQMWTSENFNFGRYSTLWEDVSVGKSNLECFFLAAKRFWKVWIETAASERRLWMSHCMKMFSINVLLSIDTHSWFAKVNGVLEFVSELKMENCEAWSRGCGAYHTRQ